MPPSLSDQSRQQRIQNRSRGQTRGYPRVRARPILPGARYKVTRRCLERRFFLAPSPEVNNFIGYWLAVCLKRFNLSLYAACFLSNHYHLDLKDLDGRLPEFKCAFNSVLARGLNALRGRFDQFWSADQPCDVLLTDDDAVLSRMAYTLSNPACAGLVRWGNRWPGFSTYGLKPGAVLRFERPNFFFDPMNEDLPAVIELRIERPDILPLLSDEAFFERLMGETRARERRAQDRRRQGTIRVVGESRLRKQRWRDRPKASELRFTPTPKFSSPNHWLRIRQHQRDRDWERRYAIAREAYRRGELLVEFPEGTYWMRVFARVRVAEAPP